MERKLDPGPSSEMSNGTIMGSDCGIQGDCCLDDVNESGNTTASANLPTIVSSTASKFSSNGENWKMEGKSMPDSLHIISTKQIPITNGYSVVNGKLSGDDETVNLSEEMSHTHPTVNGVKFIEENKLDSHANQSTMNGKHCIEDDDETLDLPDKMRVYSEKPCSLVNNNLVEEKCNFRCQQDKAYCLYHKFPTKVNNNVYSEKSALKDGMDEYFKLNSTHSRSTNSSSSSSSSSSSNNLKQSTNTYSNKFNVSSNCSKNILSSYPDQINALNGEEDDEDDGCIYTYKGENYEANLSHLLDTCLSCGLPNTEKCGVGNRGTISIQRLLNGSPHPVNPPEQNNLYSPEMDFLEMDFDPGSNGDGELDSDCEDNCVQECDSRLGNDRNSSVINFNGTSTSTGTMITTTSERKANNISPEMRNLMCRRCESSMCDDKVDNVTSSLVVDSSRLDLNLQNNPYAGLDDRPAAINSILNVPSNSFKNLSKDLNMKMNVNDSNSEKKFPDCLVEDAAVCSPDEGEEEDYYDGDSVENNLAEGEYLPEFSEGEEADDEGDDSNSEQLTLPNAQTSSSLFCPSANCNSSVCPASTSSRIPAEQFDWQSYNKSSCSDSIKSNSNNNSTVHFCRNSNVCRTNNDCTSNNSNYTSSNSNNNNNNNNLGSTSAPEVSPAKEFSPLEKFARSMSFHNQLSSPKYENICFPQRLKNSECSHNQPCNTTTTNCGVGCNCCSSSTNGSNSLTSATLKNSESANIEACVDRLCRRENSVFNILSDSTSRQTCKTSKCYNNYVPITNGLTSSITSGNQTLNLAVTNTNTTTTTTTNNTNTKTVNQHMDKPTTTTIPSPPLTTGSLLSENYQGNLLPSLLFGMSTKGSDGMTSQSITNSFKSLQPKSDDPLQDPNTASEESLNVVSNGEHVGDNNSGGNSQMQKVMIWTERQATRRQVPQIGTSACGATAVINVLLALDQRSPLDVVKGTIETRLRAENALLVEYLLSRSVAGTTHSDLIQGVSKLTEAAVTARFFNMFPKRAVQLSRWLAHWISLGGVPVATLNLQVGVSPGQTVPDSWHHQMIFGVGPQGIYLTNPLECVCDSLLADQLCSDSVLMVRRSDVVSRWGANGDHLFKLTQNSDPRWIEMNVLGQVVGVLKEWAAPPMLQGRRHLTSHVTIPAAYQSGITMYMRTDNEHCSMLLNSEDLPLLE